jgi:TRAP-type C4-dicarboxylate transport system permease small subunit
VTPQEQQTPSLRKAAVLYTLGRFGLFALFALLIWSATGAFGHQVNGIPLLLASLLASAIVGVFVLARQRTAFAAALAGKRDAKTADIARRRARLDGTDGPSA